MLVLRDADGWEYWYIHINNDTPGTDDGLNPLDHAFAPGIAVGAPVEGRAGRGLRRRQRQRRVDRLPPPLRDPPAGGAGHRPLPEPATGPGPPLREPLRLRHQPGAGTGGGVGARLLAARRRRRRLLLRRRRVLRLDRRDQAEPAGGGHGRHPGREGLLVRRHRRRGLHLRVGVVLRLHRGDHGSTSRSSGWPPPPPGDGYWLVARDGGIFAFGDAGFYGSTGAITLDQPIIGMAPTPDRPGVLARRPGRRHLRLRRRRLRRLGRARRRCRRRSPTWPSPRPGKGYWLLAEDGGIYAFGDAPYRGSPAGTRPVRPAGRPAHRRQRHRPGLLGGRRRRLGDRLRRRLRPRLPEGARLHARTPRCSTSWPRRRRRHRRRRPRRRAAPRPPPGRRTTTTRRPRTQRLLKPVGRPGRSEGRADGSAPAEGSAEHHKDVSWTTARPRAVLGLPLDATRGRGAARLSLAGQGRPTPMPGGRPPTSGRWPMPGPPFDPCSRPTRRPMCWPTERLPAGWCGPSRGGLFNRSGRASPPCCESRWPGWPGEAAGHLCSAAHSGRVGRHPSERVREP